MCLVGRLWELQCVSRFCPNSVCLSCQLAPKKNNALSSCLMDHLTTLLASSDLTIQDLSKRERICRENVDQLTEEQWQLQLAQLRLQKEQIKASSKLVQQQLTPAQKRLNRTRRARKLRRKNRSLHKHLLAKDEQNKRVQLAHDQQVDEERARREQLELEQFDREDAAFLLNEVSRKKKDLISFHQKVISLEKYRSIANQTESGSSIKNLDAFTPLKETIINRLVLYNKEETDIKQVFNIKCTIKKKTVDQKEQQQATLKKLLKKHPDQWQSTLVKKILPVHSPELSPEFGSDIPAEWCKYVSLSSSCDRPNMNSNNMPTPSNSLSFWRKYSLSWEIFCSNNKFSTVVHNKFPKVHQHYINITASTFHCNFPAKIETVQPGIPSLQ